MTIQEAKRLLIKYRKGQCSPEEEEIIRQWYQSLLDEERGASEAEPGETDPTEARGTDPMEAGGIDLLGARLKAKIDLEIEAGDRTVALVRKWPRWAAAAILLAGLGSAGYWWLGNKGKGHLPAAVSSVLGKTDIGPGGNKAILKLGNGTMIALSGAGQDTLIRQGAGRLAAIGNGRVVCKATGAVGTSPENNIITTPRGGQYQVVLPDGTGVWLNAESSLTFPTAFTGGVRQVTVTGEAYFEVAGKRGQPFEVLANGVKVEVLGTHFNINAYDDEPAVKTTLLEGAVKVRNGNGAEVLRPGEEAVVAGSAIQVETADVDQAVAWKNGFISFKSAGIKTIMRAVEKWYDVSVAYKGNLPDRTFTGEISRTANLSELLRILEVNNIHFDVEGKKIIVSP